MGGVTFEIIIHLIMLGVYTYAFAYAYQLVKKLYGGKCTEALPYLLMGIALIFGMSLLHLVDVISPILDGSEAYLYSAQMLQLLAGFFFLNALYKIYQSRYATEGFLNFEEPVTKGGKKK
jgi:TRAP-type C4-dicarboxylate transport system permease small subunit